MWAEHAPDEDDRMLAYDYVKVCLVFFILKQLTLTRIVRRTVTKGTILLD